jgi:Zn-dependent metalloprotease
LRIRRLLVAVCICVLVPAAVAYAAVNGTFRGKTSEKAPGHNSVVIKVVNGVVQKNASSIKYSAGCGKNTALTGATTIFGSLLKGNKFAVVNAHYTSPVSGGYTAHHTTTIKFSIRGKTAKGTFNNSAVITKGGKTIARCATGRLTFTATK